MPQQTASWDLGLVSTNNGDVVDEPEFEYEISVMFWCYTCQMNRAYLLTDTGWQCIGCKSYKEKGEGKGKGNDEPQEVLQGLW